jgi:hypothetical protein
MTVAETWYSPVFGAVNTPVVGYKINFFNK